MALILTTSQNTSTDHLVGQAVGHNSVVSSERVECHAPSTYRVNDLSAKVARAGRLSPRDMAYEAVLTHWEAQGIARRRSGGHGGGARWEVRDMVNGGDEWLPMATRGQEGRGDRAEFSHIISAENGGCFCGCNLLPERGNMNQARGSRDIVSLSMGARAVVAAWPKHWLNETKVTGTAKRRLGAA